MAGKTLEKDPAVKVARQRLSVLEMAETLGNISEACRRGGMDRTSFYEWKRRFQTYGLEGLKDMLYLALNDMGHRRTKVKSPQTNGFIERFNKTVLDEFYRIAFRENFYESVEALQGDLVKWLVHYNTERPHRDYRNCGKRPYDTILDFARIVRQA